MSEATEAQYYSDIISNYGRSSSIIHNLEGHIPRFATGMMKRLGLYKPPLELTVDKEITVNLPWIPSARELTKDGDSIVDRLFDYLSDIVQRSELDPNGESTVNLRLEAESADNFWAYLGCKDDDERLDYSPEILIYLALSFNQKFEERYKVQCSGAGMSGHSNRDIRFKIKQAN